MKATIDLPDLLYRRLKAAAALEGRTIREVAIELLGAWVEEHAPGGLQQTAGRPTRIAELRPGLAVSSRGSSAPPESLGVARAGGRSGPGSLAVPSEVEGEPEAPSADQAPPGGESDRSAAWLRDWDRIWAAVAGRAAEPPTTFEILIGDRR